MVYWNLFSIDVQEYHSHNWCVSLDAIQYWFWKALSVSFIATTCHYSGDRPRAKDTKNAPKPASRGAASYNSKNIKWFYSYWKNPYMNILLDDGNYQTIGLPSTAHTSHGGHQNRQQPFARSRSLAGCWIVITVDAILIYLII